MKQAMLDLRGISASYGAIQALDDVSLQVFPGEIVTLIGSNGAGKSTLLMSLFSMPRIHQGSITFLNEALHTRKTHEIAELGIALVPEGRRIFPGMTVLENLLIGVNPGKPFDQSKVQSLLEQVFSMFPILKNRKTQRAGTLSGGEQQMLAIGRALMSEPKLLLLDEPSLGLAPLIVNQIFKIIKDIRDQGTTVFFVEQNANHALKLADRAYVLAGGRIKMTGSGLELLEDPSIKEAYLGGASH